MNTSKQFAADFDKFIQWKLKNSTSGTPADVWMTRNQKNGASSAQAEH